MDFGDEERYLLVYALAKSIEDADKRLRVYLEAQGWKAIPFPVDWTKAQILVNKLYSVTHMAHLIAAKYESPGQIDLSQIKHSISRKMSQNMKWHRQFKQLMTQIDRYERSPSQELLVEIMDKCAALHLLPEYKSNGA